MLPCHDGEKVVYIYIQLYSPFTV